MDRCRETSTRETTGAGRLVPGEGFEPPTFGLQNRCTTAVLTRHGARPGLEIIRKPPPAAIVSDVVPIIQGFATMVGLTTTPDLACPGRPNQSRAQGGCA